ncbi:MAG: hypothetical protein ACODAD_11315, partial [Planctomycetota bacterium]
MQSTRKEGTMRGSRIAVIMGLFVAVAISSVYAQPAIPPDVSNATATENSQGGETVIPTES